MRNSKNESGLSIANVPLPDGAETQHIWINGTVGSGKTVAFSELMAQVRDKKQRAIVYDITGTLTARFYRPGKDIILNPFDARSKAWSMWAECETSLDYEMMAAALIPIVPGAQNQDPFWLKGARSLLAATARQLAKQSYPNKPKTVELLRYFLTADLAKLQGLLKDTEAEALVSEKLEKTALSVKAVLNDYIKSLRFLPDADEKTRLFSIKHWMAQEDTDRWLFITSKVNYHETLMPLISTWYDVAITAALSLPEDEQRRVYCFLDDLPTLQLSSLKKGLVLGRKFGLCFVLGTQDLNELNAIYGRDHTKALIANCNTKIILRSIDSGEEITKCFNQSDAAALASELQNLDNLEFYLKLPGNARTMKKKLAYVKYSNPEPNFVPRDFELDELMNNEKPVDLFSI